MLKIPLAGNPSLRLPAFLLAAIPLLLAPMARAQDAAFEGLGVLLGDASSQALDLSTDGAVVVGFSDDGGAMEAFRWTTGGGMVGLGFLTGGIFSLSYDASADGAVVVGQSGSDQGLGFEAFRWTQATGMQGLGFPLDSFSSEAFGVSGDGSVVVGNSDLIATGLGRAFRWTAGGGMQDLGVLPGTGASQAFAASADGSVVVGGSGKPFRWTEAGGMVELGCLAGGCVGAAADVSADGSVVVGVGVGSNGLNEAFRWTQAGGIVGLGVLAGSTASQAFGVSSDGEVVVGRSSGRAFVWTQGEGMRDLQAVLEDLGLDLTGWQLSTAEGVSADGTAIAGHGTNPQGQTEAFRAVLGTPVAAEPAPFQAAAPVLHAPTPNPSAGAVRLAFDLAAPGHIRLSLFDMLGREVAALFDGERAAGRHEAFFNAAQLAPGVYVVRLMAGGALRTRLLTVVR